MQVDLECALLDGRAEAHRRPASVSTAFSSAASTITSLSATSAAPSRPDSASNASAHNEGQGSGGAKGAVRRIEVLEAELKRAKEERLALEARVAEATAAAGMCTA
jgi:hypothetical protein